MAPARFTGSFTQQEPIPDDAIAAATQVMRSGRLHRYNLAAGEEAEVTALEREYAAWQGAQFCLAVASGGQAMQIALRAAGVTAGTPVLTNAFTLAPVPGAIAAVGAEPVLVEITDDLVIDLDDLDAKAEAWDARVLLLSHMRGHQCDMDRLVALARDRRLRVIEDCAHTMGATWNGRRSGNFGLAGCFSTQTYKHINSGEGGFLTTDDPDLAARAIILSGSYMLYGRHGAAPPSEVFARVRLETPNLSARMDNLRAALLRPQLRQIECNVTRWNALHDRLTRRLSAVQGIRMPDRPQAEGYVGSSIQFLLPNISDAAAKIFLETAAADGCELKWFGARVPVGFTSSHHSWTYVRKQSLPHTDAILSGLFDMRVPLTFTIEDCDTLGEVISDAVAAAYSA